MSSVSYTGRPGRRQQPVPLAAVAAVLLALSLAGCSRLGMPFNQAADDSLTTGSIALVKAAVSDRVDPSDWQTIRQTLSRIPAGAGAGTSLDWHNSLTNSGGTVSVAAAAAPRNGALCRGFVATINDLRGIRRYRGEACRNANGWQLSGVIPEDGAAL